MFFLKRRRPNGLQKLKNDCRCDLDLIGSGKESNEILSTGSCTDVSDLYNPPVPLAQLDPILLPNELLLQKFSSKKSMYKPSEWKKKCQQCIPENSYKHLADGSVLGSVYVSTDRIIFTPRSASHVGFSINIIDITSMQVIQCHDGSKAAATSTKSKPGLGQWYFMSYVNSNVITIPFSSKIRSKTFLKLIANIRFEHMVRKHLPPTYCNDDKNIDWINEDTNLPSYDESEQALRLYLISQGLLRENQTLDRSMGLSSLLIALASCPPTDNNPNHHAGHSSSSSENCRRLDPRRMIRGQTSTWQPRDVSEAPQSTPPFVWF